MAFIVMAKETRNKSKFSHTAGRLTMFSFEFLIGAADSDLELEYFYVTARNQMVAREAMIAFFNAKHELFVEYSCRHWNLKNAAQMMQWVG